IDELLGILEIARLSESDYERIVIDTAPTGHTLRLLAAPDTVAAVAEILDALQEQHRIIRDQLARVGRVEASDRLIAMLAAHGRGRAVLLVPAQLREPHGQRGLAALGRVMAHGSGLMASGSWSKAEPSAIDHLPSAISHQPWRGAHSAAPESIAAFQRASLLF